MGITKPTYSFRIDEETMNKIKKYAESENRSLSNYIETLVKEHVKTKDKEG